jgi:multiple sugar transport system substrate-binding protein
MADQFSRRSFLRLAAVSSVGLAFAACAPAPAPSASESDAEPAAGEVATVRFHSRVGVQGDYYTEMAEKFNEEHPDIKIVVETFPGENPEYLQKISTMIAADTIGDAMWAASIHNFYNYAAANLYLALDDFVEADSYDLSVFYPVAVESCRYEGKMYGLPWIVL